MMLVVIELIIDQHPKRPLYKIHKLVLAWLPIIPQVGNGVGKVVFFLLSMYIYELFKQ